MWMMTEHGAYWVGQHREKPEMVLIRARRREHLEALKPAIEASHSSYTLRLAFEDVVAEDWSFAIQETPACDFPYRATMPRMLWGAVARHLAEDIDYGTFKGRLRERHGATGPYYRFIVDCWSASFEMEDRRDGERDTAILRTKEVAE